MMHGKAGNETVSSKFNGINISKSYTGYVYDGNNQLWNDRARMYNCAGEEFIQKDLKQEII